MRRRHWLLLAGLWGAGAAASTVQRGRPLVFPRDHGAHLAARTEWWYVTGWLGSFDAPRAGFQVTFFRHRTGLAPDNPSRFAARQLLFAHAAITDLDARRHRHAARIARWTGAPGAPLAQAAVHDTDVHIGRWSLRREAGGYRAAIDAGETGAPVSLDLALQPTQPLLLQGDAGFSRKGPQEHQASHYLSEPQLAVRAPPAEGRAWLDHEWSDEILHPEAVGWDWAGINLRDGSALTIFQLRRADGSALWAGGSWRRPGAAARAFEPADLTMTPGRRWLSPATGARYPVQWTLDTPAGRFTLHTLLDAQELDDTGAGGIYWEGLSELLDAQGRRVGLGYLEMTGYAGRLRL